MATVEGLTAQHTLEVLAGKAPTDGTPRMVMFNGIAWPTERPADASNILFVDPSGLAPIPAIFDSSSDLLIQPGVA